MFDRFKINIRNISNLHQMTGYLVQTENHNILERHHLFKCLSGTLISQQYICDGIVDCPEATATDELNCICNSSKKENKITIIIHMC